MSGSRETALKCRGRQLARSTLAMLAVGLGACASRPGSKPVPPPVIEKAADTKVPDAGDAAPPPDSAPK